MIPSPVIVMQDKETKTRKTKTRQAEGGEGTGSRPIVPPVAKVLISYIGQVPALGDSSARLVLSGKDPFALETKPHGHGDVHHLLFREGVAEDLHRRGFEWLIFFQDTNALVRHKGTPVIHPLGVTSIISTIHLRGTSRTVPMCL